MDKRWAVAGALAMIVSVGVGSTAGAGPTRNPQTFDCVFPRSAPFSVPTTFDVAGRSGFVNGQHYLAHNLLIVETFDPAGPAPAVETLRQTRWSSGRTGGLPCSQTSTRSSAAGVTTRTVRFDAIPTGSNVCSDPRIPPGFC